VALNSRTMTAAKKTTKGKNKVELSSRGAAKGPKKSARASVSPSQLKAAVKKLDVSALTVKPASKPLAAAKVRVKTVVTSTTTPAARKAGKPVRTRRVPRAELVASEIAQAMLGEMESFGSEDSALQRQAQRSQRERDLLSRLAVSMQRTDEMPNLELAAELVITEDTEAVKLLIAVLERHDLEHAPDAARVLCEVGTRAPEMLLKHVDKLLALCDESQREVLPYTMYAISPVAHRHAETLWDMRDLFWSALADLTQPTDMAQAGAVRLLSSLCAAGADYARTLAGGLVDLLGKCMPKDVAFFAESVLPALGTAHSHRAKPVLDRRMKELTPAEVARLRRAVRAAQTGQPIYAAA
jgi:hypothetical protein